MNLKNSSTVVSDVRINFLFSQLAFVIVVGCATTRHLLCGVYCDVLVPEPSKNDDSEGIDAISFE